MFTGLIEEVGCVVKIEKCQARYRVTVSAQKVLEGTKIGDSIATAGICLTVIALEKASFTAEIMPETLKKSQAHKWKKGFKVNLERAVQVGGRMGGHDVSGHVDQTTRVIKRHNERNAVRLRFVLEKAHFLLEPQGSVAVDGVSLTVATVDQSGFEVSLIPLTRWDTTLKNLKVGDWVNLEFPKGGPKPSATKKITRRFLIKNGF